MLWRGTMTNDVLGGPNCSNKSTVLDKSIRRLGAPLVFLQYLLNKCKYQRQTFSTLSSINIIRYVKI